jgi:hypothetical protein
MKASDKLSALLDRLISSGDRMVAASMAIKHGPKYSKVDSGEIITWANELRLFCSLAGPLIRPWKEQLQHNGYVDGLSSLQHPLDALKTVKYAINEDLLFSYRELILSEAFADLFEQARYLLDQGYFLAAGVIMRAVLEEKLRGLCQKHKLPVTKTRPTIGDFNQALYGATSPIYDKAMMLQVTALAAVGNDAAHNLPSLRIEDVKRLEHGLGDFLARFGA